MASQGGGGASVGGPTQARRRASTRASRSRRCATSSSRRSSTRRTRSARCSTTARGIIDPGPGADMNQPAAGARGPGRARAVGGRRSARRATRRARPTSRRPRPRSSSRASPPPGARSSRRSSSGCAALRPRARLRRLPRARPLRPQPQQREQGRASSGRSRTRPGAAGARHDDVHLAAFDRDDHWVARRFGEPSVLDEDVAGALVRARRPASPRTASGSRACCTSAPATPTDGKFWHAHVDGVLVLQPASRWPRAHEAADGRGAARARREPPPFHVEVLDWEAVAAWVAPDRYGPPRTPSPLPAPAEQLGGAD